MALDVFDTSGEAGREGRRTRPDFLAYLQKAFLCTFLVAFISPFVRDAMAQEGVREIEEIIVTSTKREESLYTIGLSVTALQGEDLWARGAVDFEDYAIGIPNLSFGTTDDGVLAARTVAIRGIQGIHTTGFYIDDVPLDESLDPLVLDIERLEVLRGPQGTLFGARGLGGTIRIITRQPDFSAPDYRIHAGISSTANGGLNHVIDGSVNVPLGNSVALLLTGYYKYDEGVFDRIIGPSTAPGVVVPAGTTGAITGASTARNIEDVDDRVTYGGALALLIEPTDNLSITGRAMYQMTELDGFPLADFVNAGNISLSADDLTQGRLFDIQEGGEDEWLQLSLKIDFKAPFGTFSSATGYFTRETFETEDSSEFISFSLINGIFGQAATAVPSPIFQFLEFTTLTEEFRFVSDFGGRFEVTSGIFYQLTDDDQAYIPQNIAEGFGNVLLPLAPGGGLVATGSDLIFTSDRDNEIEEFGIYGEFDITVTDRFSFTLGARYFDTEVKSIDDIDGFAAGGPSFRSSNQSESGLNLKGLLEWQINDEVYVYASVAEGFRIGGANGALPDALGCQAQLATAGFSSAQSENYDSDELVSYEAGVKVNRYDPRLGALSLNAAAFLIDFEDIQQTVLLTCGFSFVANLGSASSRGLEVEFTLKPVDRLTLQAAIGYTDAEFTDTVANLLISDGDPLQQVPEWTLGLSGDYSAPLAGALEWFIRLDLTYVDDSVSTVNARDVPRNRPSYELFNGRIGIRGGNWNVAFFAENLFDEAAVFSDNRNIAAESSNRPRVSRNRPRTIGVDFRYDF